MPNKFDAHERLILTALCDGEAAKQVDYESSLKWLPQYRFDAIITPRDDERRKIVVSVCRREDLERVAMRQVVAKKQPIREVREGYDPHVCDYRFVILIKDWDWRKEDNSKQCNDADHADFVLAWTFEQIMGDDCLVYRIMYEDRDPQKEIIGLEDISNQTHVTIREQRHGDAE